MILCVCFSRPAVALIRKLIAVLESIERLPLHLYDTPGSSYNLQVSQRVFEVLVCYLEKLSVMLLAIITACDKICLCALDSYTEIAVPAGASAGRDGPDRPDRSYVEDGTACNCGVSGAVPAEDGEKTLKMHSTKIQLGNTWTVGGKNHNFGTLSQVYLWPFTDSMPKSGFR